MKKNKFHLNNKGFAITSIIYSMLLLFIVLITIVIATLTRKKILLEQNKKNTLELLQLMDTVFTYSYTGDYQEFLVPVSGYYQIELWGAQGGSVWGEGINQYGNSRGQLTYAGGKGAYTKGIIFLEKGTTLYIYIGGKGSDNGSLNWCIDGDVGGYNGGASLSGGQCAWGGASGGGATDIRYFENRTPTANELLWNSNLGLKSRIMVAAGGGGANFRNEGYGEGNGGAGGALEGLKGLEALTSGSYHRTDYPLGYSIGTGGTQISGGYIENYTLNGNVNYDYTTSRGIFGMSISNQSTGGGGYYGGGSNGHGGSGGGSSFISGYSGCKAIDRNGNPTDQAMHYSNSVFLNSIMIPGNANMPSHSGSGTIEGNTGNGYAKITYVSNQEMKPYTATNLIQNGGFENGINSWSKYVSGSAGLNYDSANQYTYTTTEEKYSGNYSLKFDMNIYNHHMLSQPFINGAPTLNHIYYGAIRYKTSDNFSTNDSRYELIYSDIDGALLTFAQKVRSNSWNLVSQIGKIDVNDYLGENWVIRNFASKNGTANSWIYMDSLILIDLTATFGSGNEPSKEWCDANIEYFDGTKVIYK